MTLAHEMRQVLAELTLISYGSTQAFDSSGGHDSDPDQRPSGEAHPLAEKWRDEWKARPTRETIEGARAELDAWKRRAAPAADVEWDEDAWMLERVIDKGEGFSAEQVARSVNCTPTMVRRLRLKHGRESEFGLSTEVPTHRESEDEKHERIRNLADRGCTERQIAFQVGVGKSTVRRALGRAA